MSWTLKGIKLDDPKYCDGCPCVEIDYTVYDKDAICNITDSVLNLARINNNLFYSAIRPADCPLIEENND